MNSGSCILLRIFDVRSQTGRVTLYALSEHYSLYAFVFKAAPFSFMLKLSPDYIVHF